MSAAVRIRGEFDSSRVRNRYQFGISGKFWMIAKGNEQGVDFILALRVDGLQSLIRLKHF